MDHFAYVDKRVHKCPLLCTRRACIDSMSTVSACSEMTHLRLSNRDLPDSFGQGESGGERPGALGGEPANRSRRRRRPETAGRRLTNAENRDRGKRRECPVCGAPPGDPCMETFGIRAGLSVRMHPERFA
jgi:hypothetical protein